MQVDFHQDDQLPPGAIRITVNASQLTPDVAQLINQLSKVQGCAAVFPLTVDDRIELVGLTAIIAIEVFGSELSVTTVDQQYTLRGQLKTILERIADSRFIKVARGTAINIDHLNSLEAGFSGNMTAFLDGNMRLSVSRKYLPALKERLRM